MNQNAKNNEHEFANRSWLAKFKVAVRGIGEGVTGPAGNSGPNSFVIHFPCAMIVIVAGVVLQLDRVSMSLLLLCIGLVFVAELINSSIERLAKSVTDQPNEHVRAALDIASGAVLVASLTAVAVGATVFAKALLGG